MKADFADTAIGVVAAGDSGGKTSEGQRTPRAKPARDKAGTESGGAKRREVEKT
jgi:hypothetical protein